MLADCLVRKLDEQLLVPFEIITLITFPPYAKKGKEHTEDNEDNDDVT